MPHGLSSEEIEWLRERYRLFREGDPAYLDSYTADAKFIFPATLPGGGTYDGPFEALEFTTAVTELFEDPYPDPEEFLRVEDRVIVIGTWHAQSRQSGEEIAARFVHLLLLSGPDGPVNEQKVVSFENVTDTAAMLQALGPSPPPAG
jgi:ketosteroid isomerase-like protein